MAFRVARILEEAPIRKIAIVGGTHGNEYCGAFLVRRFRKHADLIQRASFDMVESILGNPLAFQENRRFIHSDLNRSFGQSTLENVDIASYEAARAKELDNRFGPKAGEGASGRDFVIDLHTSTANMGLCLIVCDKDAIAIRAAAYVKQVLAEEEDVRIIYHTMTPSEGPYLCTAGRSGLMIEMGPVAQGVISHNIVRRSERATHALLDFLHAHNTSSVPRLNPRVPVFTTGEDKVPMPMGEDGKPDAMFHEDFEGTDFQPLRRGTPIFSQLDGSNICYDGEDGLYPIFINEGAYYYAESGIGFALCRLEEMVLEGEDE